MKAWPTNAWEACSWEAQARALELAAQRARERDARLAAILAHGAQHAVVRPMTWCQLLRAAGFTEAEAQAELEGVLERVRAAPAGAGAAAVAP